jgi:omega-6 fatty acid desaturase (delta-12 desaturase)
MSTLPSADALRVHVSRYERPDAWRAFWAFATSLPPLLVLWWLMYRSLPVSYLLTLVLAFPAAGFVVRTFIVQHDCGHGSFVASRRWRTIIGRVCAPFTLLPYSYFRHFHGTHHATSGNLDKRHVDIETITVREYRTLSPAAQRRYRLMRHPLVLFGLGPFVYFVILMRLPMLARPEWKRERRSMLATNVAIALIVWLVVSLVGWRAFLLVQAPITVIASTVGMWMFYVQHQFEDTYWAPDGEWDFARAALEGSSYYALPEVLAWFTGYIGYHHIHHLSPRVPSYRLVACHRDTDLFAGVRHISLREGFACARLALWDEEAGRLVPLPSRRQVPGANASPSIT